MSASPGGDVKIKCFTWNVGNAEPDEAELEHWLPDSDTDVFDLVVVGTQENAFKVGSGKKGASAESLTTTGGSEAPAEDGPRDSVQTDMRPSLTKEETKVHLEASQKVREKDAKLWDSMVTRRLGSGYTCVRSVTLWEMRLSVFAKKQHVHPGNLNLKRVRQASSATGGPGGLLGNKGGLLVTLTLHNTSFAFISSHLAAHSPQLAKRNKNCQEILEETAPAIGSRYLDAVSQFDHVFWIGDLNYRVDLNMGHKEPLYADEVEHHQAVLGLIAKGDWPALLAADQLRHARAEGEAFVNFEEGDSLFKPTFKVNRQHDIEYKDQRIPSYCDRILWKSMPTLKGHVEQTALRVVPEVSTSDHKPVLAHFEVKPTAKIDMHGTTASMPSMMPRLMSTASSGSTLQAQRTPRGQRRNPVLRLRHLEISELADFDIGGGSDPYCVFYTNPPGLIDEDKRAPTTTTKTVKGGKAARTTSEAIASVTSAPSIVMAGVSAATAAAVELTEVQPTVAPPPSSEESTELLSNKSGEAVCAKACEWSDAEVPLLRLRMLDTSRLPHVTLIIAIVDHDMVSKDDPMGVVLVPLTPPEKTAEGHPIDGVPHEYTVTVDAPICRFGSTRTTTGGAVVGHLKASLTVSHGEKLNSALHVAEAEDCGKLTSSIADKSTFGSCCVVA